MSSYLYPDHQILLSSPYHSTYTCFPNQRLISSPELTFIDVNNSEITDINKEREHCIHNPDLRDKNAGSISWMAGTAVAQGLVPLLYLWMSILLSFGKWQIILKIKKNTSTDSTLEKPCVGNDDFNYLWWLLLMFGLVYDGVIDAK